MITTRQGCYPCSRRRIHCDRTEPSCKKCDSRGLACTGLGLRVRFALSAVPSQHHPENHVVSGEKLSSPAPCRTRDMGQPPQNPTYFSLSSIQSGPNLDPQPPSAAPHTLVRGKSPASSHQNDDSPSRAWWISQILAGEGDRCQQEPILLSQNLDALPLWERLMSDYCRPQALLSSTTID